MAQHILLAKAISNSDPDVFYSIELINNRLSCSCPGFVYHHAFCIHLQVMAYCTKMGVVPYGYNLTERGMEHFHLNDDCPRVDLDAVVKSLRRK